MVNEESFSTSKDKYSCKLKHNSRKEKTIMKKLKLLLPISLLLLTAVLLSSCGHVHDIVIDPEVAPTCVATGKTEGAHCSSCGEVIVKQKEIPMVAHNIEKTGCTTCDLKASEGLAYVANEKNQVWVYLGTCTDAEVIIPAYDPNGNYVYGVQFEGESAKNIKSIIFMEGREDIRATLFCPNLENIVIGNGVEAIYKLSGDLQKLKSISLPETCIVLGAVSFKDFEGLEVVKLPENLCIIGEASFFNCGGLKEINIPNYVNKIENLTFEKCKSLEKITLSEGVTFIGRRAFRDCEKLEEIVLKNCPYIDKAAFDGCFQLKTINYPGTMELFLAQEKHENWYEGMSASTKIVCTDGEISIYAYKQMINQTPED